MEYSPVESGVPQGPVLGPLLFLVYIKNIKTRVKFYADYTMLFSVVQDPYISAADLNDDLKTINQWAHQWKMEFNPDPNKEATEMLFSQKKFSPFHPSLSFNDTEVTKVNEQKHLGLTFDKKHEKHINEKLKLKKA